MTAKTNGKHRFPMKKQILQQTSTIIDWVFCNISPFIVCRIVFIDSHTFCTVKGDGDDGYAGRTKKNLGWNETDMSCKGLGSSGNPE